MRKKLLSVILVVAMLACMIPIGMVTAFAEDLCETLTCTIKRANSVTGSHFILNTGYMDGDGSQLADTESISSLNGEIITKIEAHCSCSSENIVDLQPTSGQWAKVDSENIVITGINNTTLTFQTQDNTSQYDIIKIYYTLPTHTHEAGTEYMTDGRAHWLKCADADCPLKTVEDYEIAFSSYEGPALKETLCYSEEAEIGLKMGRQGKIIGGKVSTEIGRTIIPLTQEQLDSIDNTLVIVGCDDSDDNKPVYASIDCAYTYFYDGKTKIEAAGMKNAQGEDVAAFVILDNDGKDSTVTGYGYYRLYSDSENGEFIGDILFEAPRTFKAVYDTTNDANTLNFYYDNVDHSGANKTVYEGEYNKTSNPTGLVSFKVLGSGASVKATWGYDTIKKIVKGVAIDPTVIKYKGLEYTTSMFNSMYLAESITGAEYLDVTNVKHMGSMFMDFACDYYNVPTQLEEGTGTDFNQVPDVSHWNTANVTSMDSMFTDFGASSFKLNKVPDVSHWNTSNVTAMGDMFNTFGYLSKVLDKVPDVSGWDTGKVTNMSTMFHCYGKYSEILNEVPDVSRWNTANVTTMGSSGRVAGMFAYYAASSTKLNKVPDVSNWNTEKVTDMEDVFYHYAYSSTVIDKVPNVGNWNTGNVQEFTDAFDGYAYSSTAIDFTLDLSKWDVRSANHSYPVVRMFDDAGKSARTWKVIIPAKTGDQPNDSEHWYVGDGTDQNKYIKPDVDNNRVFTVPN